MTEEQKVLPRGRGSVSKKSLKKAKPARKPSSSPKSSYAMSITAPSTPIDVLLAPHAPRPVRSWVPQYGKSDIVVVLDLDHTLVDSVGFKTSSVERRYVLDMDGQSIKGSTRPNLYQFLKYLSLFSPKVIIWTAGTKEYAEALMDVIYPEGNRPEFIWHRDHCEHNKEEDYYYKPLRKIAEEIDYDQSAILMIDDRTYTFVSNPENGLLIPPYEGNDDDDALGQIVDWLDKRSTRYSWSVTQLDKNKVFSRY